MLRILGSSSRFCDRRSRRNFLQIGGLALGGASLPQLLEAEARAGVGKNDRSIIMIYLPGGPPHQDLFDLKLDAPLEIRGEFDPIATNVAGVQICQHLPRLASMMDRMVVVRSLVGAKDRHESFQCMTGRLRDNQPQGNWPEMGSVLSKLQGSRQQGIPPYVNLAPLMQHRPYNSGYGGFLGQAHAAFQPNRECKEDMILQGINVQRLGDRRQLVKSFDGFRRSFDLGGAAEGMDAFHQQAFGVLTSGKLAKAMDLSQESPRLRQRYGSGTTKVQGDAAPRINQQFLLARRLVEAGVRCVTVAYSFWDWHGHNFARAKENFPDLDQGVAALIQDLHERGMDQQVSVVVWGEFGRTPRINKDGGRDHWPQVACALLAGGGMRTGQVIGSTNRWGEHAQDRPVHFQEVHATLYHNLGIDIRKATVHDLHGRPRYLVDHNRYQPMAELI